MARLDDYQFVTPTYSIEKKKLTLGSCLLSLERGCYAFHSHHMPSQDQPHTLIRYRYRIQLQCPYQIGAQEDQTLYQHL